MEETREGCHFGCLFGGQARWPNRVEIFIAVRLTGAQTKPRDFACCGQGISAWLRSQNDKSCFKIDSEDVILKRGLQSLSQRTFRTHIPSHLSGAAADPISSYCGGEWIEVGAQN